MATENWQLKKMNLTCIIVDDEPMARNLLAAYVEKIPNLTLLSAFGNPLEALAYLQETEVDVLFLDVQMSELTGISLLKILKKKPIVILSTAYSEYAVEGYELDVTDYLLKPITFERFLKAMEKATQRIATEKAAENVENTTTSTTEAVAKTPTVNNSQTAFIFVKDGRKLVKVNLSDIRYIEGLKDYVKIHTINRNITTLQRLKSLEEMLPETDFIRVHHFLSLP
jgi:two-component system LytT family response regulator